MRHLKAPRPRIDRFRGGISLARIVRTDGGETEDQAMNEARVEKKACEQNLPAIVAILGAILCLILYG
jgi:hypothetical protein